MDIIQWMASIRAEMIGLDWDRYEGETDDEEEWEEVYLRFWFSIIGDMDMDVDGDGDVDSW